MNSEVLSVFYTLSPLNSLVIFIHHMSSYASVKIYLVGAFPLRSVCVPFINMHKGRVYDVTHCYNLGKKCVPPY